MIVFRHREIFICVLKWGKKRIEVSSINILRLFITKTKAKTIMSLLVETLVYFACGT